MMALVMNEEMHWVSDVGLYNSSLVSDGALNTNLYFDTHGNGVFISTVILDSKFFSPTNAPFIKHIKC
jgi:hypothetical protein